ncbi:MAG: ATP-binding cassette domain-containing protein, partial [Planctomycetes bacterium]|nr:ATP-binding cassette domain-containing protein [Planctomycetota bacterium]
MIHLEKVCKTFGDLKVLDELDLHVPRGSAFVIMGPSGAGKSVILKHIIGLLRPDSGVIRVDNMSVPDLKGEPLRDLRRDMGYLFQHSALINWLNVFDNIALPLRETMDLPEDEILDRVHHVLGLVSLSQADHK